MKNCIAIIPARGGSKRIPKKNIKSFFGEPIIKYSIEAAKKSGCFDEVMVSTDDIEISKISKECGASVPFLREENTSNDCASMEDVLIEVIDKYSKLGKKYKYGCCLMATAPFLSSEDIKEGAALIDKGDSISVFTVVQYSYPVQRALEIKDDWVNLVWPENLDKRSQELEPRYHDAGQFYFFDVEKFKIERQLLSQNSKAIVLPEIKVQDIDTIDDWVMAESKFQFLKKEKI
jgi:N-acylneuraminate cytidylyltransferase